MFDMDYYWELDKKSKEKKAKFDAEMLELRKKELAKKGLTLQEIGPKTEEEKEREFSGWAEHPNTPENSTATFFWIVAAVVLLLFKGGWILSIIATIIWFNFITRHDQRRKL